MSPDLPQLRMVHRLVAMAPERTLPDGYELRNARPEDAGGIAGVLSLAFQEPWDSGKVDAELLQNPNVPTTFVIEHNSRVVATASYQWKDDDEWPCNSWLHWVGADPAEAGKGLGYSIAREVLEEARRHADDEVRLLTDDHRLAAIKTYAKLNFKPEPWHESHAERWGRVWSQIAPAIPPGGWR